MSQIAIVQPAAPQIPPAGPPANSDKQQFSTHFDKAVASKKDHLNPGENESSNPSQKSSSRKGPAAEGPASATADIAAQDSPSTGPAQEIATADTSPVESGEGIVDRGEGMELDEGMGIQIFADALFSKEIPADITFSAFSSSSNITLSDNLPNEGKEAALPLARILAPGINGSSSQPLTEGFDFTDDSVETASPNTPPVGQKTATDALLVQLQQIIDNSDEKGTVTIARVATPPTTINDGRNAQAILPQPVANSSGQNHIAISSQYPSQYAELNSEAPVFVVSEGFKIPTEKSDLQLTSLRQNSQQQYYEAKINMQSAGQEESMPQESKQQHGEPGTSTPTVAGQTSSPATPMIGEQTNTFAQSLATVQDSPSLPASEPGKTVTLPSGMLVHEEDVIRQVLERFQVSRRQLDTQINIKLHPAELGELKIDLTVKEGSIRANVMAQSQHAQEIIEKNMMKLRTVLEAHGFTIDDITVASKSDSTGDATLFDKQLFSRSDYTPRSNKRRNGSEAGFRFEEAFLPSQPTTTGVNVKI